MKTDERLMQELSEAAEGLLLMSESDHPLRVIRWGAGVEPTAEFLRGLTGHGPSAPVEERSPAEFFRAPASEPEWKAGAELEAARRFQALQRLLEENLEGLKVYRVGEIDMPVYIVGRTPAGSWVGLRTRVVET
jgi:hypothetical protein